MCLLNRISAKNLFINLLSRVLYKYFLDFQIKRISCFTRKTVYFTLYVYIFFLQQCRAKHATLSAIIFVKHECLHNCSILVKCWNMSRLLECLRVLLWKQTAWGRCSFWVYRILIYFWLISKRERLRPF